MKLPYETPSILIERFDLKDPDLVTSVWSDEDVMEFELEF